MDRSGPVPLDCDVEAPKPTFSFHPTINRSEEAVIPVRKSIRKSALYVPDV